MNRGLSNTRLKDLLTLPVPCLTDTHQGWNQNSIVESEHHYLASTAQQSKKNFMGACNKQKTIKYLVTFTLTNII